MSARRYALVRYPWKAAVDLSDPAPARMYLALIGQALRFGMPARRRPAPLFALAGRRGIPERMLARAVRLAPKAERPDLDALAGDLEAAWPHLAAACSRLAPDPGRLSLLAMDRRAALTVFAFAGGRPAVVAKIPEGADPRVDHEARALLEAEPAGVAPRLLPSVGFARVQEAIPGAPLRLEPVTPARAGSLPWKPELDRLADGLVRLAEATRKGEPNDELAAPVELALASGLLSSGSHEALAAALAEIRDAPASVLRNRDTSAQNCLYEDGVLTGIVDWEGAVSRGVPGFDLLNAALAYLEQGLGLTRWSQDAAVEAFAAAWSGPFGAGARSAAARCAAAGGLDERDDALVTAFLGWRVGRRLENPPFYPTTAATAARMLDLSVASTRS